MHMSTHTHGLCAQATAPAKPLPESPPHQRGPQVHYHFSGQDACACDVYVGDYPQQASTGAPLIRGRPRCTTTCNSPP
eukprot:1158013-Pelagomonas_calceolata.AAC.2